ncbi:MAG: hypothetical protein AAB263_18370 [Planctomycetota bacterium]
MPDEMPNAGMLECWNDRIFKRSTANSAATPGRRAVAFRNRLSIFNATFQHSSIPAFGISSFGIQRVL